MIFGCLFVVLLLAGMLWACHLERKEWNGGICRENGKRWELFDMDSHGHRGYRAGNKYTWITYPGIDKERT